MNKNKYLYLFWIVVFVLIAISPPLIYGQASLAAEDIIDDVAIDINGEKLLFTVIRDANQKEQWYYAPARATLYERAVNGKKEPEFTLIKYQFPDPTDRQKLLEGGIMQFALTLGIPPEAKEQLVGAIAKLVDTGKDKIRLAALPFKDASVHLYTPGGDLITSEKLGDGIAPTLANQKMVFAIQFTRLGADIYDALVNGNTGLAVAVSFTYYGTNATGWI